MSEGHVAAIRFGFGLRAGEPPPADPKAWAKAQLTATPPAMLGPQTSLSDALEAIEAQRNAVRNAVRNDRREPNAPRPLGQFQRAEFEGWLATCVTTPAPYRERLTAFWFNHFTVARRKGQLVATTVSDYVRHAIRPHVTGKFPELLLAVVRHPAMLGYLDNQQSVGPNSPDGERQQRGLNENLAREILELHTVTPAAGYTQADVTEFAKVLTGWSIARETGFAFRPQLHEPGAKTVLGRSWPEGEQGGVALLRWLAAHPATRKNLATKLVRHFYADVPPPASVARIEAVLRDSQGDLGVAAAALLELPGAFQAPLAKIRPPHDFVIAALRGCGADERAARFGVDAMSELGQPLWNAQSPKGWPDIADDWTGPEALLRRVDWAHTLAGRFTRSVDPNAAAAAALGPLARGDTRDTMSRAGSPQDALTILVASPEFQRR